MLKNQFYLGDWQVDPTANTLKLGKIKRTLEPKAMDVLLLLCQQQGNVVAADDIVLQCWPNSPVGDNPIHKTITQLRRTLGDKASAPIYIETIRKRGYRIIADVEFLTDEQTRAAETQWQGQSPFPGLRAFSSQQSGVYFGRSATIRKLLSSINHQFKRQRALTLIIGPSGSGKSSLIHAGILPKLVDRKGIEDIQAADAISLDMADISATEFIENVAAHLIDLTIAHTPVFEGESIASLALLLKQTPERVIAIAKHTLLGSQAFKQVRYPCFVIVIDRLESYLTAPSIDDSQRSAAFALLETLAQSNVFSVILACRNDFYPLVAQYPSLMRGKERGAHFDIAAPTVAELSQMIRLPAIAAELNWQHDNESGTSLDDIILADAIREPDCLPLLQYTLQELYFQRQDNTLLVDTYHKLGGIDGAIGHRAEQLFIQMTEKVQDTFETILPLIVSITNDGNTLTSRASPWSLLTSQYEKAFVEEMVENRLFISHLHQGVACFKVAHEALLRRWPRVQQWMQQHQSALVCKKRLAEQTSLWLQDNKSTAFLLTEGKPLTDAISLVNNYSVGLTPEERELIHASQSKQRRKRTVRGVTLALLACLTVLSFAAMLQSKHSLYLAERKRLEAENLMGYMIGDFADKLRSVMRMDLLDGISEQALAYVEAAQNEQSTGIFSPALPPPSFTLRFQHALSLQAMAEVRYHRNDIDTAKSTYEEADVRLSTLLKEQPANYELLKAAGANAFWLGNIAYWADDLQNAEHNFTRYLTLSEKMLSVAPDNPEAILEVAYATNSLGSLAYKQLMFDRSLSYFEKSLDFKQQYSQLSSEDIEAQIAVADTYSWIASSLINKGEIESALSALATAERRLASLLTRESKNAAIMEALIFTYIRTSEYMAYRADIDTGLSKLAKAKSMLEELLRQDPENTLWQEDFDNVTIRMALYRSQSTTATNSDPLTAYSISTLNNASPTISLYYALYLQQRGNWDTSEALLNSIADKLITSDAKSIAAFKRRTYLLIAKTRQANHQGLQDELTQQCRLLKNLSEDLTLRSADPLFLMANIIASQCLEAPDNRARKNEEQLNQMGVIRPPYLTIT